MPDNFTFAKLIIEKIINTNLYIFFIKNKIKIFINIMCLNLEINMSIKLK